MLVDGGANIGNSVVSFRLMNRAAPIVSFEPAPWLEPALAWLSAHDPAMTYHLAGLSERRERVSLYVPCLDRRPNFYLASALFSRFEEPRLTDVLRLMGAEPGQQFALHETEVELAPLDDFALAPSIIKLDVEDFEAPALRGAAGTVGRHRPMVMVETANRQPEIVAFFADQRYRFCTRSGDQLRLDDGVTEASNGFYLAAERLDEYRGRGILRDDR
jgi:FkbM family methyltransferase